ncbi:MAG TPA: VOC family protein [Solirubrobacteraceae bacterium]|jgi:PhnB protein|nr:VOC family protein [Solirubrobacteraceae bacterium]
MAKAIPDDYPQLMPYLIIDGASEAIEFYKRVFGANERMRMGGPDGRVGHAELDIGDAVVMLADANPDTGMQHPRAIGGTPVTLHLYVQDADATFDRAVQHGAKPLRPMEDRFYGDRSGQFEDPYGHRWNVATHVEDVSEQEMQRRMAELTGS